MKENFTPDNSRIFEIQNYVQANYQKQLESERSGSEIVFIECIFIQIY